MPRLSQDRTLPTAITNIKLCSALRDCGDLGVVNTFDKSEASLLFIYDDRDLKYTDWTVTEPDFRSKCFVAKNPNGTTIVLLPLDGRTITGKNVTKGGVCDSMLLTETEISLIEFKTDATSSSSQNIMQRANKGVDQLWHTFDSIIKPRCAKQSKDIEQLLSIDFYVVFDKNLEITRANSELMDLQTQFLEDKKHMLYFDNEKTFK